MARSDICIPRILKHEGGYVDDPRDPGGATNKGITIATFRRYIKPNGTKDDLRVMNTAQAVVVYKRQYWDKVMADSLPIGIDYAVADFAVNSGPSRAAKYLQRVVGVSQDGRIGPQTLGAAEKMKPREVIERLCDDRLAFMKRIKNRKTGSLLWTTFGRGWKARVDAVRRDAIADAAAIEPVQFIEPPDAPPATEIPQRPGLIAAIIAFLKGFMK